MQFGQHCFFVFADGSIARLAACSVRLQGYCDICVCALKRPAVQVTTPFHSEMDVALPCIFFHECGGPLGPLGSCECDRLTESRPLRQGASSYLFQKNSEIGCVALYLVWKIQLFPLHGFKAVVFCFEYRVIIGGKLRFKPTYILPRKKTIAKGEKWKSACWGRTGDGGRGGRRHKRGWVYRKPG